MANKPTKAEYEGFKKAIANPMTPQPIKDKLQSVIDKYASEYEGTGEGSTEAKPTKAPRKPRATKEKATTTPSKRGRKPSSTSEAKADAYEKAKADLKKKTGKTEEECEAIIDQYRELRAKAQTRKAKEEEASKENKKRVEKLERKGDIIEGTNEKTADAVIETATEEVADKIEKQIEAVEEKAEKEAKAEVAKDKTLKTPKAKKEAVEAKVEKKVAEKTKTIVKRVVIDTSALLTSIANTLGKFDKDSQKEFLIKLRSDIDKLLSKYAFGGMTDGASQVMNIQQSNLSASSVNPTLFAKGGGVSNKDVKIRIESISVDVYEDSYEEGEGKFVNSYTRTDFKGELVSPHQLIARLHDELDLSNDPRDYSIYEGVIFTSQLVDRNGGKAFPSEIERWKKGDFELFSENTNIRVSIVHPTEVTDEELSKLTGIGLYKKGGKVKISKKFAKGGGVGGKRLFALVDNFDAKSQNYDQLYYKNDDYNKVINYIADLKNEGEYPKNAQLIEVMSNGKMRKFDSSMLANGGGVGSVSYDEVLDLLKEKLEDSVDDLPTHFEMSSEFKGEEVEHESRDGFIAFTDGGYEVRWFEYLSMFYGAGYGLPTRALDNEKDRQIEYNFTYAKERFMDEYPEIVEELGEENIDYNSLYDAGYGDEAEQLSEWEMDFDGEDTIMCEIGAYYYSPNNHRGIDGKHTLRLFGLVNLESPYHRSGNLEDRYDIDITFDSIQDLEQKIDEGLEAIIRWFDGDFYNDSTEELRIRRMAQGGMTEHGLREGDRIIGDVDSEKDSIYIVDSKKRGHIVNLGEGKRYNKGGSVNYTKKWEVIGINRYGKKFKEIITLGRMSDKEDVKNALRRRSDLNISEVTSIKEVFAKGGGISAMLRNRRGK